MSDEARSVPSNDHPWRDEPLGRSMRVFELIDYEYSFLPLDHAREFDEREVPPEGYYQDRERLTVPGIGKQGRILLAAPE